MVKHLRGLSGWGWDDTRKIIIAPDDVWDAYLAASLYNIEIYHNY